MPHPTMLVHLVQVFFECFSRNFPFLQYEDVSRRVFNGTLSPLLANSIASLAARYSQSSDVLARGASAVSNAYGDAAKVSSRSGPLSQSLLRSDQPFYPQRLLQDSSHVPYIEILHAVIVLAWSEYKAGRVAGPTEYSQVCVVSRCGTTLLRALRAILLMIYANSDGHQACDEPRARKRRYRTDCERARAHTTPLYLDFGRATPTDRRLSCLRTISLFSWLFTCFFLTILYALHAQGWVDRKRSDFLGSMRTFRECRGAGTAYRELRTAPHSRPIPPLLLSHYFRIIVLRFASSICGGCPMYCILCPILDLIIYIAQ